MFSNIFKNKTVLITGHTGFKGSWASLWLHKMGANVVGVSDKELTVPSNYSSIGLKNIITDIRLDIRNLDDIKKAIIDISPDYLFHFAAQSLVSISYKDPIQTFTKNTIGTLNILESIREYNKRMTAIFVTSDKVYENVEWVWGYRENDKLGGNDPYSSSKGMAELVIKSYSNSFFKNSDIKIGIGRAGNVIGGGDWSVDRIVPDCLKAWYSDNEVVIRNPKSTRPWQFVLEPISGYFLMAEYLSKGKIKSGEAFNFGPNSADNFRVIDLLNEMKKYYKNGKIVLNNSKSNKIKEAGLLKLNCDKALSELEWKSNLNFNKTIEMTMQWYNYYYNNLGQSMYEFSKDQIDEYVNIALSQKI